MSTVGLVGAASGGGDSAEAVAADLVRRFLDQVGTNGSLRLLARARDAVVPRGREKSLNEHSIQLSNDYDQKHQLRWSEPLQSFLLGGEPIDEAGAIAAVASALRARPGLQGSLLRFFDYQQKSYVEDAAHDFVDERSRYADGLSMKSALDGKTTPRRPHGTPPLFGAGDVTNATRAFTGLRIARDRVEADCLAKIQSLPRPRTAAERVHYLKCIGYQDDVARKIVELTPHIAKAIIELAVKSARIPHDAKEGWSFYYEGDLAFQPVTLKRGIDAERFDPRRVLRFEKEAGREFNFFSDAYGYPFMRSIWSYTGGKAGPERQKGLIVEFQLPKFLVMVSDNAHPILLQKMVPDHEAFISRIGAVPFNRAAAEISDHADEQNITMVEWRGGEAMAEWIAPPNPGSPPARLEVFDPAEWVSAGG